MRDRGVSQGDQRGEADEAEESEKAGAGGAAAGRFDRLEDTRLRCVLSYWALGGAFPAPGDQDEAE